MPRATRSNAVVAVCPEDWVVVFGSVVVSRVVSGVVSGVVSLGLLGPEEGTPSP